MKQEEINIDIVARTPDKLNDRTEKEEFVKK